MHSIEATPACASKDASLRPRVGDAVRAFLPALLAAHALTDTQRRMLLALSRCRTEALGGWVETCDRCGHPVGHFNPCGHRHCPSCQGTEQRRWIEQRHARILPAPYFHVVFTMPETLRDLAWRNPREMYGILMRAASSTLLTLSADPRRLGAIPAINTVLHTWTRKLLYHPHVHAVISAGGLSEDRDRWIASPSRGRYLFPVRVLAKLFRRIVRAAVIEGLGDGSIRLPEDGPADVLDALRRSLFGTRWHVYAKAPFGGAKHVYAYLGNYTHRVGLSNTRMRSMDAQSVTFATKNGGVETVAGESFVRRLAMHVLPPGFTRIRHSGLLAPAHVGSMLVRAQQLLAPREPADSAVEPAEPTAPTATESVARPMNDTTETRCPACHCGTLRRPAVLAFDPAPEPNDSS